MEKSRFSYPGTLYLDTCNQIKIKSLLRPNASNAALISNSFLGSVFSSLIENISF